MKSKIILLFLLSFLSAFSQQKELTGIILDSETLLPLQNANIYLTKNKSGTTSDRQGKFILKEVPESDTLIISYLGYKQLMLPVSQLQNNQTFYLDRKILPSQTVLVEASIGQKGVTPLTFEKIKREQIQKDYVVQDIPQYLSQLPSTTFYSENGNGIGYNYLSIRGFDQRRISVSINGIPQNDPEDHNVYWLDFPDLLASTELIQVQRGAGSGVIGYPAVGGSINIITSPFSDKAKLNISSSYGSFHTRKYSAAFSSGLIDNKYSFYAKLSQILSSGYRNLSWAKFNAYHLSAVRYDENLTTQFNFFGGPISDGLAYTGIAKFAVKDKNLRRTNYSYWEADETGYTFTVNRRPEEIENFSQPHFELLNEYKFNDDVKFNSALFLVIGEGFFDYDGSWSIYYDDYFRLRANGFDTNYVPTNAIIRAQVENKQYGWIPRLSLSHKNGELILGGELRIHRSNHWGNINYAENLPPNISKDYYYYFYNGAKDIASIYAHESYRLNDQINLLGELQVAYHKYKLYNERYVGNDFSISDIFFNPRLGINYKISDQFNSFISFARVTREPRLKNYYDAAESSAGEVPQFELNSDGTYNFSKPLVKPETMNDFEIGFSFSNQFISASTNFYYMIFNDEIVRKGQVDRFGQPITGNVDQTIHSGAELQLTAKITEALDVFGNFTYSNNEIKNGKYFLGGTDFIDLTGNKISGFPDVLANFGIQFKQNNLFLKLSGKYVGKMYSDNFDDNLKNYLNQFPNFVDYSDNINDAYFVMDFYGSYDFKLFDALDNSKIFLQVNNLFDNLYSAYAIGKEFFPAAERNFIAGIQLGL
ncbi:TonB-dependent receptor plug [Ignavibacterium album JCM 16511]|uniref:TonB-dependent receptor plug n=1 Tax=Ignavibacterium album (strain DSM 19864 / JCM 16511 / NBRC 101810 / Mat9-16) TaxID=945713 RepID=I0AKF0_IGNAJ|nr:TonB-dependent receptor [Ignavibacterium album]AFH49457.1 TonB-dependent receptor plug [Ignavibacterium album JCM 16511]